MDPPVGSNVAHEQNAGVHVEVERRSAHRAVQKMKMGRATGIVGDTNGETQADEEVGGR